MDKRERKLFHSVALWKKTISISLCISYSSNIFPFLSFFSSVLHSLSFPSCILLFISPSIFPSYLSFPAYSILSLFPPAFSFSLILLFSFLYFLPFLFCFHSSFPLFSFPYFRFSLPASTLFPLFLPAFFFKILQFPSSQLIPAFSSPSFSSSCILL